MSQLQGRPYRAVLTGAAGGIGQSLAFALAPQCSAMLLVGREIGKLNALSQVLRLRHPQMTVALVVADLASDAGRAAVLQESQNLKGGINLLINNAGLSDFHGFGGQPAKRIEALISTNLLSPMLLCQKFLPMLQAQEQAQIINIGSVFGDIGYPGFAAYCASKSGLRGFTQALRRELSDSPVRVRYFAPRATRTSINDAAVNAMNDALKTPSDSPEVVAMAFMSFLGSRQNERILGWPERLYVIINRLRHQITDKAIGQQLATIKRYLPH
jgi:short-subunit dehydrogenase